MSLSAMANEAAGRYRPEQGVRPTLSMLSRLERSEIGNIRAIALEKASSLQVDKARAEMLAEAVVRALKEPTVGGTRSAPDSAPLPPSPHPESPGQEDTDTSQKQGRAPFRLGPAAKSAGVGAAVTDAFKNISTYIPTEILGAYIPALAAVAAARQQSLRWTIFWLFLGITPLATWLVFARLAYEQGKPLPTHPRTWPYWALLAGLIAFGAYAAALPGSVFHDLSWFNDGLGLTAVLIVALLLHIGTEINNMIHGDPARP